MNDAIKFVCKGAGGFLIFAGGFNLLLAFAAPIIPEAREVLFKKGLSTFIGGFTFLLSIDIGMMLVGWWLFSKEEFPTAAELPGLLFRGIKYAIGMYVIFLGALLVIAFPIIPFIENGTIGSALFSLIFGSGLIFTGKTIVGKNNL